MKTCSVPGCGGRHHGHGLCLKHYFRLRNTGDPLGLRKTGYKPRPLADRLWEKVAVGGLDECWPFMGSRNEKGYGRISMGLDQSPEGAHRVAFRETRGEIPDGFDVCHHCDNPPCCNPVCLFAGTRQENMDDCVAKGRQARGESLSTKRRGIE